MSVDQLPPGKARPAKRDAQFVRYNEYIDKQIDSTRRSVKAVDLLTALLAMAVGTMSFLLAAAMIEHWLVPGGFSVAVRLLLFVALAVCLTFYTTRRLWPLVRGSINPAYAAQAIEQENPSLKNSLLNLLLFRQHRDDVTDAVYETLEAEAATRLHRVPIDSAVDRTQLLRLGYALIFILAVVALYKILSPKDPFASAERVLMPWARIAAPSRVSIENIEPGHVTLSRGDTLAVAADVRGIGDDDPVVVRFTTADGQAVDRPATMKPDAAGLRFKGQIPPEGDAALGVAQDLRYHIEAGDARSLEYKVTVISAPLITIERVDYDYPDYTGYADRSIDRLGDIRAIEGTRVTIHARANQSIEEAAIDFESDGRRDVQLKPQGELAQATFTLELRDDRQTAKFTSYAIRFTGVDGRANRNPVKYPIEVVPDVQPEAAILAPKEKTRDVRLDERVEISVEARDPDFALSGVRVEGESAGRKVIDERLLGREHNGRFTGRLVFKPSEHALHSGDVVRYWVVAQDNRAPKANETATDSQTLRIVGPDQQKSPQDRPAPHDKTGQRDQPGQRDPQQQSNEEKNQQGQQGQDQSGEGEQGQSGGQSSDSSQGGQQGENEQSSDSSSSEGESGESGGQGAANQSSENGSGEQSQNQQQGEQQSGERQPGGESNGGGQSSASEQGGESGQAQQRPGGKPQSGEGGQPGQQSSPQQGSPEGSQQPSQGSEANGQSGQAGEQQNSQSDSQESNTGERRSEGGGRDADSNSKRGGEDAPARDARDAGDSSPVSSEGDNDGEAFERIQEFLKKEGQLPKDSSEQNAKEQSSGEKGGEQQPGKTSSDNSETGQQESADGQTGKQQSGEQQSGTQQSGEQRGASGDQQGDAERPNDSSSQKSERDSDTASGDSQAQSEGQTPGAKTQSGNQQSKTEEPSADGKKQQPDGGQQTNSQGQSGAGNQPEQGQGAPESQDLKPTEKWQQRPSGDKQGEQQDTPSGGHGKRESDSQGDQGGDHAGGGEEGGGQKSNRDGTGSSGQNQSADEGAGESSEQGAGRNSSSGGQDAQANERTGESSRSMQGKGSEQRDGEGNQSGGERGNQQGQSQGGEQGEKQEGGADSAGGQQEKQGQDGQQGQQQKPSPSGGEHGENSAQHGGEDAPARDAQNQKSNEAQGAQRSGNNAADGAGRVPDAPIQPGSSTGEAPGADAANLDYARKRTDLVLETLAEQMKRQKVDKRLLDKLGWTEADMKRFVERWQQLKAAADANGPDANDAQRELDDALRSLGLHRGQLQQVKVTDDQNRNLRQGYRGAVPLEYQERLRAYNQGVSRARQEDD